MATTALAALTPDTRERIQALLDAGKAQGFDLMVGSTLRSCADQGNSDATVTVQGMRLKRAHGCRSWHVWGRAADILIRNNPTPERYLQLGQLAESLGLQWGGRFVSNPDPIHFQYPGGLNILKLCPDPADCANTVARGGVLVAAPDPSPQPPGLPEDNDADGTQLSVTNLHLVFAAAAAVGWVAFRVLSKKSVF